MLPIFVAFFFFFNDTATTEIYTLSLHDALPISAVADTEQAAIEVTDLVRRSVHRAAAIDLPRSEEHTSELQSQSNLVCRLLLEKKKKRTYDTRLPSSSPIRTSSWPQSSGSV